MLAKQEALAHLTTENGKSVAERNEVVEKYLPLIKKIAREVKNCHPDFLDYDDLVTSGVFGLMRAFDNFDESYNVSFAGYCQARIRGAMYDEIRQIDWVPRQIRRQSNIVNKVRDRLQVEFSRMPSREEIARELEMDVDEYEKIESQSQVSKMISLDNTTNDDDAGSSIAGLFVNEKCSSPDETLENKEILKEFTRSLTRTEKLIVILYYQEDLTMRQIGQLLGLSESRVCQIHTQILTQIRHSMQLPSGKSDSKKHGEMVTC